MACQRQDSPVEFAHFTSLQLGPQRPSPNKGSFLFVVKTPKSDLLSRSTSRSAAASINSHAQRWAQEAALSNTRQPSGSDDCPSHTETLSFDKCVTRYRLDRLVNSDNRPPKPRRRRVKTPQAKLQSSIVTQSSQPATVSGKTCTTSSDSETKANAIMGPRPVTWPPSIIRFPTSPSFDPLIPASLPRDLPRDGNADSVLQYYLSFVLLSMPQKDCLTPSRTITHHSSIIRAIVQGCMQEEVHLYSLLAATASRMRLVSGVRFRADNGPESYLGKAMQKLRGMLNTELTRKDRQLILDIYYLSVCEWYLGNYEAADTHFKFVKTFWKSLEPDLSTIDNYLHDMLAYMGGFVSPVQKFEPPRSSFPLSVHPFALSAPCLQTSGPGCVEAGCSSFPNALEAVTYSNDLKQIIRDLVSIPGIFQHLRQRFHHGESLSPETGWFQWRCRGLTHRLLSPPSYGNELCCRLALALVLAHMSQVVETNIACIVSEMYSSTSESTLWVRRLRRQLQYEILLPCNEINPKALLQSPSQVSSSSLPPPNPLTPLDPIWTGKSHELLLWILLTGLFFAGKRTDLQDEKSWFEPRVRALLTGLAIEDKAQLSALMDSFLSLPEMMSDDLFVSSVI